MPNGLNHKLQNLQNKILKGELAALSDDEKTLMFSHTVVRRGVGHEKESEPAPNEH